MGEIEEEFTSVSARGPLLVPCSGMTHGSAQAPNAVPEVKPRLNTSKASLFIPRPASWTLTCFYKATRKFPS